MSSPIHALLYRKSRGAERLPVERPSTMRIDDGIPHDIVIEDLSQSGFRIRTDDTPGQDEMILIGLAGLGARPALVVWRRDGLAGCAFEQSLSREELETTLAAHTLVQARSGSKRDGTGPPARRMRFRQRTGAIILGIISIWGVLVAAVTVLIRNLAG